jgi:serine protease Do
VKPGDVVEMVDGKPVDSYLALLRRIGLLAPGSAVKIKVQRDNKGFEFNITLMTRPASEVSGSAPASRIEGIGLLLRELPQAVAQKLQLPGGLLVESVMPGSPAELGGMLAGDVVLEVNREPATLNALQEAMKEVPPQTILLKLQRNDRARYVALKPH